MSLAPKKRCQHWLAAMLLRHACETSRRLPVPSGYFQLSVSLRRTTANRRDLDSIEERNRVLRGISDYMKIGPDQIAPWIPGGLTSLALTNLAEATFGPDYGDFLKSMRRWPSSRSFTRCRKRGPLKRKSWEKAIRDLNVDSEKNYPSDLTWRDSGARGWTGLRS